MTLRGRAPWLVSAGLHLAGLAALALFLQETEPPPPLRMHFSAPSGSAGSSSPARANLTPAPHKPGVFEAPALPAWRPVSPAELPAPPASSSALLGELLLPSVPDSPRAGWSGPSGQGYAPPPLPPPGLAPPQGAQWTLSLRVPGGGGPATAVDGLDSGHPALDQWLEDYLRTVSFPSSPDGLEYQVRWALRLQSEKPQ